MSSLHLPTPALINAKQFTQELADLMNRYDPNMPGGKQDTNREYIAYILLGTAMGLLINHDSETSKKAGMFIYQAATKALFHLTRDEENILSDINLQVWSNVMKKEIARTSSPERN